MLAAAGVLVRATLTVGRIGAGWLVVVLAGFLAVRAMPGDPVTVFLGASGVGGDEAVRAAYRAAWGLDRPLAQQFVDWLGGFLTLDWGTELGTGRPIRDKVLAGLPWSLVIGCGGLMLGGAVGVALGFRAALHPGGAADGLSRALAVGAQAVPAFAIGLVLLWAFAVEWRIVRVFSGAPLERLVLPVLLVALFSVGAVARVTRAAFAEVAAMPYLATARAKGLSPTAALWRHGRRRAAIVLLASLAPELSWAVGGTAVAETVFAVPGLSTGLVEAVAARDYPMLQASVAIIAAWIIAALGLAGLLRRRLETRRPDAGLA